MPHQFDPALLAVLLSAGFFGWVMLLIVCLTASVIFLAAAFSEGGVPVVRVAVLVPCC